MILEIEFVCVLVLSNDHEHTYYGYFHLIMMGMMGCVTVVMGC